MSVCGTVTTTNRAQAHAYTWACGTVEAILFGEEDFGQARNVNLKKRENDAILSDYML